MQLKVLSWNIWIDCHFDQITEFLESTQPDIIGLQEVQEDDQSREIIKFLKSLEYHHAFAPIAKTWGGKVWNDGPAIFSKFEITSANIFLLSQDDKRALLQTDIQVADKTLHVFSTHLTHTHQQESDVQARQVDELLKHIPNSSTILMGDFNATPDSTTIQKIQTKLVDTDQRDLPTWSNYPEGCTTCKPQRVDTKLDYIFASSDLKTHSFAVGQSKGSDHLPISVVVEI